MRCGWPGGQAPLRLLFMQPSLSLGLWLIQAAASGI
ncbi:arginine:ornithine antiporter [Klebsiella pneumoniae]|uniref:Arginine:ornithine antiporter n=1 Tax=Klebsiella pneumoniae TaxID=573 RepID=A0A3S4H5S1_KLEPN|nr:arginine:ornithine antiporter [Klebsiella pneumoniae]